MLAAIGCASPPALLEPSPAPLTLTVQTFRYGTSTATDPGQPLGDVTVTINQQRVGRTDANGRYVGAIAAGAVTVSVAKAGWVALMPSASGDVWASGERWSFWLTPEVGQ